MVDGEGVGRSFLDAAIATFESTKSMGDRALAQMGEDEMRLVVGHDANPVSVIVKHLHGNMVSRWTDFLESDGEKAGRDRDGEFVDDGASRDEVMRRWEEGWGVVLSTMRGLAPGDLERTVRIRGEEMSVARAVCRQIEHYGYHVGQIVLIGKVVVGEGWRTLTVERGGSGEFNRGMGYGG